MKHIHFDVESDGFYGAYWACKDGSDCTVIAPCSATTPRIIWRTRR